MLLMLDAGNSRLKWGAWEQGRWQCRQAVDYGELQSLQATWRRLAPSWAGVSCVASPEVRNSLAELLQASCRDVFWLEAQAELSGLHNAYHQAGQLGSDRYALLYACHCLGWAPCVVASAGTALTVDALAADGRFLGGMIAPGLDLLRTALGRGTAGLSSLRGAWEAFPKSTGDAVETGILTMLAGSLEAMVHRLQAREDEPVGVVLTGGNAHELAPCLPFNCRVVDDLVLEGLLWVARNHRVPGA